MEDREACSGCFPVRSLVDFAVFVVELGLRDATAPSDAAPPSTFAVRALVDHPRVACQPNLTRTSRERTW